MSKTRTVEEIIRPIANDRALVERAAVLLRPMTIQDHKWYQDRDQWLRDAGEEEK